jgi:hypothetical protein
MSRALITIHDKTDRKRAAKWAMQVPPMTRIEFKECKRTLDQNSLMWARLTEIACKVEWYGEKLTTHDWKDIFTASLRKARIVPGLDPGTCVALGMHTSDMGVEEMGMLLDLIDAFAAEKGVAFKETEISK